MSAQRATPMEGEAVFPSVENSAPAMSGAPFRVLGGGGVLRTLCWTGGCLFRVWRAIAGLPVGTCVGNRVVVTGGAPDCFLGLPLLA